MKEPKKYKLNLDAPNTKEPKKIRMDSINPNEYEQMCDSNSKYDIYSWDNDSIYVPVDLEKIN